MAEKTRLNHQDKRNVKHVSRETAEHAVKGTGSDPAEQRLADAGKEAIRHIMEKGFEALKPDQTREVIKNLKPEFPGIDKD